MLWIRAIILSLAVHLLLFFLMARLPHDVQPTPAETTEVEILTPPKKNQNEKQIVRQALVPDQLKAPDDDTLARFLSEQKQRVKKETQSALKGMTKNSEPGDKQDSQQQQQQNQKQAQQKKSDRSPNPQDSSSKRDLAKEGFKDWNPGTNPMQQRRRGDGPSTTGENLPQDVSVGSFTALDTDRYTFYTFYARIEEMIRFRWESRVQATIEGLDRNTLQTVGERAWITSAEFLLDRSGRLVKALVMKESGIKGFDAAAVGAFREANMFPNPPQEMVQEDGYIHLKYNFNVSYRPPIMAR